MKHVTTEEPKPFWDNDNSSWGVSSSTIYANNSGLSTPDGSKRSSNASEYCTKDDYSTPPTFYCQDLPSATCNVKPTQFTMWVGTSDYVGGVNEHIHTYSELALKNPVLPRMALDSIEDWEARFPCLQNILHTGKETTVIYIESSVSVMSISPLDSLILGTNLEVNYTDTIINCQWECTTRIYAPGKKVWDNTQPVSQSEQYDGTTKLALPFASEFWAAFYTSLSQSQPEIESSKSMSILRAREKEGEICAAISGITVVQELANLIPTIYGGRRLTAVFLWEFTPADVGEPGITQWREIVTTPSHLHSQNDVVTQMLNMQQQQQQQQQQWQSQQPHFTLSLSPPQGMFLPSPLVTPTDDIAVIDAHPVSAEDVLPWPNMPQFAFDPEFGIAVGPPSGNIAPRPGVTCGITTISDALTGTSAQLTGGSTLSPINYFTETCTPASSRSLFSSISSSSSSSSSASNPASASSATTLDDATYPEYIHENQRHQHENTQGYDSNGLSIFMPIVGENQVDDSTGGWVDFLGGGAPAEAGVWINGFSNPGSGGLGRVWPV